MPPLPRTLPRGSSDREGYISRQPAILEFCRFKLDPENWVIFLFICAFSCMLLYLLWPYILGLKVVLGESWGLVLATW
jgi:hypothetical protein